MEKQIREKLEKLAQLTFDQIHENENNVKHKFIAPFFNCFGYDETIDFEHAAQSGRVDLILNTERNYKIIVEAKAYSKKLDDDCVKQLQKYANELNPLLAILVNGDEIRFYSFIKWKSDFNERLIYLIKRNQLSNPEVQERIFKILSLEMYNSGEIEKNLEERELEINKFKEEISIFKNKIEAERNKIEAEIENFILQKAEIEKAIKELELKKADIDLNKIEDDILEKNYLQFFKISKKKNEKNIEKNTKATEKGDFKKKSDALTDSILPVIKSINNGMKHTLAFKTIAKKLDITSNTVSSNCTRTLNLNVKDFLEYIANGEIKEYLKKYYPDRIDVIEREI